MYWIYTRRWSGQPWLATGLTDPELAKAMTRIQQKEERIEASKDVDVTKPEKLTNLKNWQTFWEKWDNYMGQVYGAADIPLQYVYRGHDVVTIEMRNRPYETDEQDAAGELAKAALELPQRPCGEEKEGDGIKHPFNAGPHASQAGTRMDTGHFDTNSVRMVPVGILLGP